MPTLLVGGSITTATVPAARRANVRSYNVVDQDGAIATVRMPSRQAIKNALDARSFASQVFLTGVVVTTPNDSVTLPALVVGTPRRRGGDYEVFLADGMYGATTNPSVALVAAALNNTPSTAVPRMTPAVRNVPTAQALGWMDDFRLFSPVYREVRDAGIEHPEFHDVMPGEFHTVGTLSALGRTFGLEIEVDFPESNSWGSEKRALARRLYDEGLSLSDQVRGWHYAARAGNSNGERHGYTTDRNRWTVEFDRSVDDCDGERGCEIVSPILHNTPETWQDVKKVIDIITELGGQVNVRHGLHVNIGAGDLVGDTMTHVSLVRSLRHFDDLLVRLSHTPENGRWHRGRNYCANVDDTGMSHFLARGSSRYAAEIISNIVAYNGHRSAVNFTHMPVIASRISTATRLEFRIFDGTLNVGRIQMDVMLCMAMVAAAIRNTDESLFADAEEFGGTHLAARSDRRRLSGDAWRADTERIREFVDFLALDEIAAKDVVTAYVASRWQRA